uniref:Uncharacterized protein n=1 Tax=Arundo donax TaxID=35708 RepID=A0A0A9FBW7_ARUDO
MPRLTLESFRMDLDVQTLHSH